MSTTTEVVKAISRVLDRYWLDKEKNTYSFPVDPVTIAQRMGLKVEPYPLGYKDHLGELQDKTIRYSRELPIETQRIVIAHEIGHYALGHGSSFYDSNENFDVLTSDINEKMANAFAIALLVPGPAIRYLVDKKGITDPELIKQKLIVPSSAVAIQMRSLGYA